MLRHSLLVILLTLICPIIWGQKGDYVEFRRFDAGRIGVKEISFQTWDTEGKCWAVSEEGFISFDGYNTTFHKHNPLDDNSVLSDTVMRVFQTDPDITIVHRPTVLHPGVDALR